MLRVTQRNAQRVYIGLHMLYLMTYALMFAYASTFLQNKGFTNTQIGIIIGSSFILASLLQPLFAGLFVRLPGAIESHMGKTYILLACLSFIMLFFVKNKLLLAVCVVVVMGGQAALQPSLNSCVRRWSEAGCSICYSPARSAGSFAYAITSLGFGMLIKKMNPGLLPAFYGASMLAFAFVLLGIRLPKQSAAAEDVKEIGNDGSAKMTAGLVIVIVGICFLIFGHTIIDNYMLQILTNAGGNSSDVGIVVAVGSVAEVIAMSLYDRLGKRFGDGKLLVFAAAVWVLKHFLTYLAKTPMEIYFIELLQFCGYAFYTPGIVSYVNKHFSGQANLKWLAYTGSAYTAGAVIASFCGGYVLDALGASAMLLMASGASAVGLVIFAAYFMRKK